MKTLSMAAMVAGMLALVGCGGSDAPQALGGAGGSGGTGGEPQLVTCGSSELFAQSHNACGAMDAAGTTGDNGAECRCLIGFAWNGSSCVALSGCACQGADCDKLTETQEQCQTLHASCSSEPPLTLSCGSSQMYSLQHNVCGAMDALDSPDENGMSCDCFLGYAWNGTECVGLGDCRCVGADCDKLTQTIEECQNAHGSCTGEPLPLSCGSSQLFSKTHDACSAMDATASPDESGASCNCFLGFAWNGSECVGLGDCRCVGADCDKLTQTIEECQNAHSSCTDAPPTISCGSSQLFSQTHDACTAMDAAAAPDQSGSSCYCLLGYAWNGSACVELGDCRCVGADCDKLTQTVEECQTAHAACD